jgi:hypothetical protein
VSEFCLTVVIRIVQMWTEGHVKRKERSLYDPRLLAQNAVMRGDVTAGLTKIKQTTER